MADPNWVAAEIGRVLYTHALDPALAEGPLAMTAEAASALVMGGPIKIEPGRVEHGELLLNVLVRLEVRCAHDPVAIRAALDRPSPELGGQSLRETLAGAPSTERMRSARAAAGTLPIPKVKMWRVADRYS